jgi:hypothetical protein
MPTSEEAPPPYAKDPQQDPNVSRPRSPPRAYGWQNRQPAANPAPNVTQPGATAMMFPVDGSYPYFDRNCHHVWFTQFGLLGILCAIVRISCHMKFTAHLCLIDLSILIVFLPVRTSMPPVRLQISSDTSHINLSLNSCDRQEVCIRCGARRFPAF